MSQEPSSGSPFFTGFRKGAVQSSPFVIVFVPFSLLFGVIGTEAGLNIAQVLGFSVFVLAGAAQITAVTLMVEQAPTLIILATALAVNLRMGMYSAALVPAFGNLSFWKRGVIAYYLFDQPFALTAIDMAKNPKRPQAERYGFYMGVAIPYSILWYVGTLAGALLSETIPMDMGVDFAVPATFLALVAPLLRSIPHVAAALTSVIGTLLFAEFPFNTGLLAAAILALVVGTEVERRLPAKQAGEANDH